MHSEDHRRSLFLLFYTVELTRDLMFDHMEVKTNALQTDLLMRNIVGDGHDAHNLITIMIIRE